MLQIIDRNSNIFDAVVVGSGATGGWAAKQLAEAGLKVALLEAGPAVTPRDFTEHVEPFDLKYRGLKGGDVPPFSKERPIQSLVYACRESNYIWFVDDTANPYTTERNKPFHWIRMRVLGGRTLSWGRQSYRLSDLDFTAASHDGYGSDWPISYQALIPYYEQVEKFVGISGQPEGLPQLPDGIFLPPMPLTCGEQLLRREAKAKFGRTVTIGRAAVATLEHNGRAACHYCGPCEQGCITNSYFSSPFTTLAAAGATGKLTLITGAVASHVAMDRATGLASGIAYVDRETRQAREIRAKIVILCASTLESTRLLLNSAPGGLANSSGVLGHYLMDHICDSRVRGEFPQLEAKPWTGMPRRPNGLFIPRFRNVKEAHTNGMIRGYNYQGNSLPAFARGGPGYGAAFKQAARRGIWQISLVAFCETLPRYENHVRLAKNKVDAWGIPALRINMTWSGNELKLWKDAQEQGAEMLAAAGAKNIGKYGQPSVPGFGIHEVGTARMGDDPKTSVLNRYHQTHEVKNLFVTDGAAFVSVGSQNPTLTMMANTVRACDHILERRRQGEFA